jgi:hypothetical protein
MERVSLCVSISSKSPLCNSRIDDNVKKRGWSLGRVLSGATRVSKEKFSFLSGLEIQPKQTRRFNELSTMKMNPLLLLVIPLLFLSGSFVNAGPVGNFFKKVGQSISKPLQSRPEPPPQPQSTRPQPTKTSHATRRPTSRAASAAATAPPAEAQSSHPSKEGESTGNVRRVSAADIEKAKAGLPYGIPVPGRKGMVTSPYLPEEDKYIDVTDFASGSVVKDPYTEKFFLVP